MTDPDIKQKLEAALKDAMRAGDATRKNTIRLVLTAIRLTEVEKGTPLDTAGIFAVLQKEVKSRRESIQDAQKANRPDLIANSEAEIKVLETFLPQPITTDELTKIAQAAIAEVQAASPADMGKVMKVLLPRLQGKAPGDQVSQVVRQLLQKP
jgi:uncharacterized protein